MKVTAKDKIMNAIFKWPLPFLSLFIAILCLYCFVLFVKTQNLLYLATFLLAPYVIPLSLWRLINFLYPLKDGGSYIAEKTFSPWLSSYRIQEIYIKFPFLERVLFLVPFLYNFWLRLWGAKIGKRVVFSPTVIIHDRPLVEIGDNVLFGDSVYFSSHLIEMRKGRFFCYTKKIKIESNSFIGAFTKFAPGAKVKSGSRIKSFSFFKVNSSTPLELPLDENTRPA